MSSSQTSTEDVSLDMKMRWSNLMSEDGSSSVQQDFEITTEDELASGTSRVSIMDKPAPTPMEQKRMETEADRMYTWDAVFVFAVGEDDKTVTYTDADKKKVKTTQKELYAKTTADIVTRLEEAGLLCDLYYSVQSDEIYCRIAASEKRLQIEADRIDTPLMLNQEHLLEYALAQDLKLAVETQKGVAPEDAWQNLYGKYDQLNPDAPGRQDLYMRYNERSANHPRYKSFFDSVTRLRLTINIIEADAKLGGSEISFSKAIENDKHSMMAFFPMHEQERLDVLNVKMNDWRSAFFSPVNDVRSYYGEKIAYYFGFLAFYNRLLVIPTIFGIFQFIWMLIDKRIDTGGMFFYALIVSVWATVFLEMWKRQEAKYRLRWGMASFEETEQPRPEFKGEWLPSPINGQLEEQFPWIQKIIRGIVSQTVVVTMILVVVGSLVGVFVFRNAIQDLGPSTATYLSAIVNAITIMVLNTVYGVISFKLNDYENHRTDSEYENSLIAKTFLFKFVNSYSSLFYIAFIKEHDTGCVNDDCLMELAQQLGTIFITAMVVNNSMEVLMPMAKNWWTARSNRAEIVESTEDDADANDPEAEAVFKQKSPAEEEFELQPYESTFDDFDELIVQYGYVTMFVTAFPLAPLGALLNNILETRVDATKLCKLSRRPEPAGAANIGTWYDILEVVSFIAVVVNMGIVFFQTEIVEGAISDLGFSDIPLGRVYMFLVAEHVIIISKFAIGYFVPDEPSGYYEHLARQDYIVAVLLGGMEEEVAFLPGEEPVSDTGDKFDWNRVSQTVPETGHEWH
jgi:Calcium-activated chloride channel